MVSITLAGRQIFVLNENDRYPEPQQNSPPFFAIREDEEASTGFMFGIKGAGRSYQMCHFRLKVKPLTRP